MVEPFAAVVVGTCLFLAVWALVLTVRDRAIDNTLFLGSGVLVLLMVVQLVLGLVLLAGLDRSIETWVFVGYLLGCVVIAPLAVVWAVAEKSRYGPAVLCVVYLVLPVLVVRLLQVWSPGGA